MNREHGSCISHFITGFERKMCTSSVHNSKADKAVNKEGKNFNPIKGLDVNFLKELLKGAEDYIIGLDVLLVQEKGLTASNQPNYLKQSLPGICSIKEEVISDDEFLDCDKCNLQCKGPCSHDEQVSSLSVTKAPQSNSDRPVMPHFLSLGSIPTAGLGVWSEISLPPGLLFGPYEGRILHQQEDPKSGYAWQVQKGQNMQCFVDGKDRSASNWLRFVNYATREEQQNVVAFQFKNRIFYKTFKHILPHTEILVWFGEEYANEMGIGSLQNMALPPAEKKVEVTLPSSSIQLNYNHILKPYQCQHCQKTFTRKSYLKVHLLIHSGERPYQCQHCQKTFTQQNSLNVHLSFLSRERPHSCQHCQMSFKTKSNLKKHLLTHSGERPHKCQNCQKAFKNRTHLKTHLLTQLN